MNILFIDGCISLHKPSRTGLLCEKYLEECRKRGDTIERVDLNESEIRPMNAERLKARQASLDAGDLETEQFSFARQFQRADRIVIGAPFWDLSLPAAVKAYIEQIMVCGITFHYVDNNASGLCRADKLIYIMTAGGFTGNQNLGYEYIKALAAMLGIGGCELICAQGLDIEGADVGRILDDTDIKSEM